MKYYISKQPPYRTKLYQKRNISVIAYFRKLSYNIVTVKEKPGTVKIYSSFLFRRRPIPPGADTAFTSVRTPLSEKHTFRIKDRRPNRGGGRFLPQLSLRQKQKRTVKPSVFFIYQPL